MPIQYDGYRILDMGRATGSDTRQINRRFLFSFLLSFLPRSATAARPRLGDDEWFRRFRVFVKLFNTFVESLNDGKFDLKIWHKMGEAWKDMDSE